MNSFISYRGIFAKGSKLGIFVFTSDLIPSDYQNYLLFTSFCNRFAYLFIVNPSPIQSKEEELKPLTIESVTQSTSQDFLLYCLDLCKVQRTLLGFM